MWNPFVSRPKIDPDVLFALRWRLPEEIEVDVKSLEDGYYFAKVKNLPGCVTQARNSQELFVMVNDAVYAYFDVPEEYRPFVRAYIP